MTYQIDTIVKDKIINTTITNNIRQASWYLMKARQHCLTSIGKVYKIDEEGNKEELF